MKLKKLLSFLIFSSLLTGCNPKPESTSSSSSSTSTSTSTSTSVAPEEVDIKLLATSDTHGKFGTHDYALDSEDTNGGLTKVATYVKEARSKNPNTILIDAGDNIQDNSADIFLEDAYLKDDAVHPMIKAFNKMGYDISVTGNHEYNFGLDILKKIIKSNKATTLVNNVKDKEGKPLGESYKIIEKGGVKIAFIGMVTPNIKTWDSANLQGCTITDPVVETKKIIAQIKDKADAIVAVSHMGIENEYGVLNSGVRDLATQCPELTAIISAHDHSQIAQNIADGKNALINGVLVIQNANAAKSVGEIDLKFVKNNGKWKLSDSSSKSVSMKTVEPDAELTRILAADNTYAINDAQTVIGNASSDFQGENEVPGIPDTMLKDTALVDLINKVQMHYANARVSAAAVFRADASLKQGNIKKKDLANIYNYQNTLYSLNMNGKQLKKFMEWSASFFTQYKERDLTIGFTSRLYNYDMFQGVQYDIDVSKPNGSRILNLKWEDTDKLVKDDDKFVIAVNNYRATTGLLKYGGGIFEKGDELPTLKEVDIEQGVGVRELIGRYIKEQRNQTIDPECNNNWRIVGTNFDPDKRQALINAIKAGTVKVPASADGRIINNRALTENDIPA